MMQKLKNLPLLVAILVGLLSPFLLVATPLQTAFADPPPTNCSASGPENPACVQCGGTGNYSSTCQDPAATKKSCDVGTNSGNCNAITGYINGAISLLSALVGVVAVISVITGGIQYSTSAGDPQKAAKAKGRIMNAIIALVAFGLLYGFLQFIIPGGLFNRG